MERFMHETLQYANQNRSAFLAQLFEFLRIPSISTQPERDHEMVEAALWLTRAMSSTGIENVRVIETGHHPLVYGEWLHAGPSSPTVLIYGHYDVQPAEPLELWETPPFEPVVRDDYVHARGSADDQGQLYIHLKAVEAYLKTARRLPVNVKFIFEGEEDIGRQHLHRL